MTISYYEMFSANVQLNAISGYCVPGLPLGSTRSQRFLYYYSRAVTASAVFHALSMLLGLLNKPSLVDLCQSVFVISLRLFHIYVAIYFIAHEGRFHQLMLDFEQVSHLCCKDPLSKLDFRIQLHKNFTLFHLLTSVAPKVNPLIAFFYILANALQKGSMKIIEKWWPCDLSISPCLEFATIIDLLMILFSMVQTVCYELFIMSLFLLMGSYFEHLKSSMENVFLRDCSMAEINQVRSINLANTESELEYVSDNNFLSHTIMIKSETNMDQDKETSSSTTADKGVLKVPAHLDTTEMRLQSWTKLHQQVLRLGKDLSQLHSTLFTAYMAFVILITITSFFIASHVKNKEGGMAVKLSIVYSLCNIVKLCAMCMIGNRMSQQSADVAVEGYWRPWYTTPKETKSCLLIILTRTRKALEARSTFPLAKLNLETYVALCNMMLSYYLALVKIKEKNQK